MSFELYHSDAFEWLSKEVADNTIDSMVTDPPAGVEFMGQEWDTFKEGRRSRAWACGGKFGNDKFGGFAKVLRPAFCSQTAQNRNEFIRCMTAVFGEIRRVLKPGAHGFVWALPRTSHWTATALEEAGLEIRDVCHHLFGCLSADTELLTDQGWVPYQKIETKHRALCYNNDEGTFAWDQIQEVFIYDYADTAYRLRGDHTDQIVSRNHRCLVERGGDYVFQVAEDVARESAVRVPVLEDLPSLLTALSVRHEGADRQEPVLWPVSSQGDVRSAAREGQRGATGRVGADPVRALRHAGRAAQEGVGVFGSNLLQPAVSRDSMDLGDRYVCDRIEGSVGLDGRVSPILPDEDGGAGQSGLEGRCDLLQEARQLPFDQVCSVSRGVQSDGAEGRLRHGASSLRGAGHRSASAAGGSGASLEPRSDGQPAGEPGVVCVEQRSQEVRASRHTSSDLVRVEPLHYVGHVWCIRVPTGAFVARRNGQVFVTGNSGFPKSHNFDGKGSALKPGAEHWILIRKPLSETSIEKNFAKWGTGCLWIDAGRINRDAADVPGWHRTGADGSDGFLGSDTFRLRPISPEEVQARNGNKGRWPANLMLSDDAVDVVDQQARVGRPRKERAAEPEPGPSRFFYCPKPTTKEREWGCEALEDSTLHRVNPGGLAGDPRWAPVTRKNDHPTVKAVSLMRWLCRLVTPLGGEIIDPFAGSGTTGVAAMFEGMRFLGIEQDLHYYSLAWARISAALRLMQTPGSSAS